MVFQLNLLENVYFISKMPGLAMVRPASSDLWKAPLGYVHTVRTVMAFCGVTQSYPL